MALLLDAVYVVRVSASTAWFNRPEYQHCLTRFQGILLVIRQLREAAERYIVYQVLIDGQELLWNMSLFEISATQLMRV